MGSNLPKGLPRPDQLSDSLVKYVALLGLEKRQPPTQDLTAYLDSKYGGDE